MRMSNFLCVERVVSRTMTPDSDPPAVGIHHPTVVPANYRPEDRADDRDGSTDA